MLCKDYDKSENDLKALQSVGQVTDRKLVIWKEMYLLFFLSNVKDCRRSS